MDAHIKEFKDEYILQDVSPGFLTDETITPNNLPRITQPSFGKYLTRADGKAERQVSEIHPLIMNRWLEKERGSWVTTPHKNDCVLKMAQKYSRSYNYHPKNTRAIPLFPRPYYYELGYIEQQRLKNVDLIEIRYHENSETIKNRLAETDKCKFSPPFWWKKSASITSLKVYDTHQEEIEDDDEIGTLRWKPVPDILGTKVRTPCERRKELNQVGLPFKHEALKFYSVNFPAPTMKTIHGHINK